MSGKNRRVWFITGNYRGFNCILTDLLLANGEAVDTNINKADRLKELQSKYPKAAIAFPVDVTNPQRLKEAIDRALASFGGIDVLGNSPSYGLIYASEGQTKEDAVRMIDFQVF